MNKYWNEYKHIYIDKEIEYKISKIFQFSTEHESQKIDQMKIIKNLNLESIKHPDICLKQINFEPLPSIIKDIFRVLEMTVSHNEYLLFIPVLAIHSGIDNLKKGIYMLDFFNNQLLLTSNEVPSILQEITDSSITIHWFLDIESTVAMFNNLAVIEGTKHIAKNQTLFELFMKENTKLESKEIKILQAQKFSKEVGLNARICVLLASNKIR
ncbi:hypothetical protein [Kurthia sibirica]|uniref:Uncharacterized protein n=1 Tax=Kurthia sibirica TaxID=202750 RepID=A0A2U3AER7_9BACL|nr:hypothetical protein [Kurthia sibirica]PWI23020.1 hypothetical protein DEX24_16525 [Kurthia sibirica]GEK35599.1 hypothetical protein KSI01_31320 [Kurthia sibirica]